MIKPQVPPGPGTIVEYLQDNQVHLAVVIEEQGGRVRLFTQRGREMALPAARLLPWHGPKYPHPASRSEMEERLGRHLEQRSELAGTIEVMDIWNLAQGEMSSAPLDWFAELIWDSPNHDQLSAIGRVLLDAKTHFKFQPPSFLIYPEQTVQARLAEQEAAREHQELVVAGQDFFSQLWKTGNTDACPPEPAAGRLKDLLLQRISNPEDPSHDELWRNLTKKLPEHPQQALILAQAWGLVPPHYNHLLDQAGYDWQNGWTQAHNQEIRTLSEAVRAQVGSLEPLRLYSVDSERTQDIDDAFALERTADGGFRLTLAIACPTLEWPWESDLDAAIAQRASSLYLPEGVCHMLPEELGIGLFSLRENEPRPALLLEFELDSEARVTSLQPRLGWVQVWANTHYELVEQDIQEGREPFAAAHALAAMLRDRRIRQGAVVFDQPDPQLMLIGEDADLQVLLESKDPAPKAQLLVSEFMVLANAELARWACDNDLPLLFRTQNVALPPGTGGHYTRPEDMYRMARMLANATLQTKPVLHASLGVQAYASVTSPLRRYVDFLNLGQVAAWIQGGSGRLSKADLDAGLPMWRSRLEAVGRVQRYRTRYWKLEYLRLQGPQKFWSAVLVDETATQAVFSLPVEQVMVRAPKRLLGDKCFIGGNYLLRLGRIDPLLNEIKVVEVVEDQTYEKE
ncbi:ribonuclease catalytic domain-containing protein [Desulfonatronum parangueonense]